MLNLDTPPELDGIAKRLREIMADLDPEIWVDHCETLSRAAISCMDCGKAITKKAEGIRKCGFQADPPSVETVPAASS